jgi:hypothetical protein
MQKEIIQNLKRNILADNCAKKSTSIKVISPTKFLKGEPLKGFRDLLANKNTQPLILKRKTGEKDLLHPFFRESLGLPRYQWDSH